MEIKNNRLIDCLDIDNKTKEILKNAGYQSVSDLIAAKKEDVEPLFDISSTSFFGYNGHRAFNQLKVMLHRDLGVTFLGEYDDMGLTGEVANVHISQLELPVAIKNILNRQLNVYTLGDLLTTDYSSILRARNFGETYLGILKDYVHGLGYTLKGEEPSLKETLTELKEKGVELLEDVMPNARMCNSLYKNGIYTIDDLLNFGPDVYKLVGFGPLRQQELFKQMQELGLSFNVVPTVTGDKPEGTIAIPRPRVAIRPTEAMVAQAQKENEAIRTRIQEKEKLVIEYDNLMQERAQLLAREKELDWLIEDKLSVLKEGGLHGRK